MPNENEQQEFLKDLEPKDFSLDKTQPIEQVVEPEVETKENRETRRLREKLQAERESSIALAARLAALEEARKSTQDTSISDDYLKSVEKIYGTETPEAQMATELLKKTLQTVEERAHTKAVETIRNEQKREREELKKQEETLDSMIEDLEDSVGVDMDAQTKKGFLSLLEKLSPKDKDGNITQYADHRAVWDELQARKQPVQNRAKDLASRSMVRTGASPQTTVQTESEQRWLIENGII